MSSTNCRPEPRPNPSIEGACMHSSNYCPVCQQAHGVGFLRVWLSGAQFPASCKSCGARFHPDTLPSVAVGELILFPVGLAATYAASSWGVVGLYVLGFTLAIAAIRAICPLVGLRV